MPRHGVVAAIKPARGMVAIATEDDGFTIIELLGEWDLEVGDDLRWDGDYGLGAEIYENLSKHSQAEVYVQNHAASQAYLPQQLRY